ncbi:MAG: hypothetical protein IJH87_00105, partial [Atopobiaceae bacterium]|nr:hypothetical protein [Atopobiaceae bacterium]
LGFASSAHPLAAFELMSMLATEEKQWSTMTEERIEAVLRMHSIPSAPTKEVKEALQRSAEASMDAELFEVARNFARALGSFDSDDVLYGVIRSIEQEPDR